MNDKLSVCRGCDLRKPCLECSSIPPCNHANMINAFNSVQQLKAEIAKLIEAYDMCCDSPCDMPNELRCHINELRQLSAV